MTDEEVLAGLKELAPLRALLDRVEDANLGITGVWIWPVDFVLGLRAYMGLPVIRVNVLAPYLALSAAEGRT